MSNNKRNPLRTPPLRQAGQSVDAELNRLIDDVALPYYMIAVFCVLLAGLEWWRYYWQHPPNPWLLTAVAVLAILVAIVKVTGVVRRARNLKLGRDGERAVGQFLERMRTRDFRVFHDIQQDSFNVDHVLVGPTGVYTVETKTRRFPKRGFPKVTYDGEQVLVNGWKPDRDCVAQAIQQAITLRQLIQRVARVETWVQPIVVFPGWIVEALPSDKKPTVWVMAPTDLPERIANQPVKLSPEEVKAISSCIANYCGSIA
jgi:hypothetical protein